MRLKENMDSWIINHFKWANDHEIYYDWYIKDPSSNTIVGRITSIVKDHRIPEIRFYITTKDGNGIYGIGREQTYDSKSTDGVFYYNGNSSPSVDLMDCLDKFIISTFKYFKEDLKSVGIDINDTDQACDWEDRIVARYDLLYNTHPNRPSMCNPTVR